MTPLPRAILFDLDETILTFGARPLILLEVAEEFADRLGALSPQGLADTVEDVRGLLVRPDATQGMAFQA